MRNTEGRNPNPPPQSLPIEARSHFPFTSNDLVHVHYGNRGSYMSTGFCDRTILFYDPILSSHRVRLDSPGAVCIAWFSLSLPNMHSRLAAASIAFLLAVLATTVHVGCGGDSPGARMMSVPDSLRPTDSTYVTGIKWTQASGEPNWTATYKMYPDSITGLTTIRNTDTMYVEMPTDFVPWLHEA